MRARRSQQHRRGRRERSVHARPRQTGLRSARRRLAVDEGERVSAGAVEMSDAVLAVVFVACAILSLGSSWVLVSRLERVGARLGLSEGLLGMLAAVAADAPEITAAVTALAGHHARIGAGVVIGSNVFNLATLLGLAAVLAGGIALHRRVIALEGIVALWIASVCLVVIVGALSAAVGLSLVLVVLAPYLAALGLRHDRLRRLGLPATWTRWLTEAIVQGEVELETAIHPQRGRTRDSVEALLATFVVIGASAAMEQTASTLGARHAIPEIVVGGLILAGVTSLPNAVAAVYLAGRGRGAATLSTAMNSNALNVTAGLLLPATVVGVGASSGQSTLIAAWYLGLTAFALGAAYISRGLRRAHGALIICAYLSFAGVLVASAYSSRAGVLLSIAVPAAAGTALAAGLRRARPRPAPSPADGHRPHAESALNQRPAAIARAAPTAFGHDDTNCTDGGAPILPVPAPSQSLVDGWSITHVWYLALATSSLIAATDAILGHHVILIGLLIVGPCCALLTGRWARTATAGAWAIALAVILGLPDQIWGTPTHVAFLAAVTIVAIVSTSSAAVLQRRL
jgi:cation:H+ antiporter